MSAYADPSVCEVHETPEPWPCGVCERCENEAWEHAEALGEAEAMLPAYVGTDWYDGQEPPW